MQAPEWLKPSLCGAACAAVALVIGGFSWGERETDVAARTIAADQSKTTVVAALSIVCVDQSQRDPQLAERAAAIMAAASWERGGIVGKSGWATVPGTTEANNEVASDRAEKVSS